MTDDGVTLAPEGQVWVCAACGKRSRTRYGFNANNVPTSIDRGWDESCMLNAVLCHAEPALKADERGIISRLYQPVENGDAP